MTSSTANLPEARTLLDVLNSSRALTQFYLKHTEGLDKSKSFTVEGFDTNSILWIVCHLAWAEDYLVLQGVGNKGLEVDWFEHFKLGAEYPAPELFPSYDDAIETFNTVHNKVNELLTSIDNNSVLDEPNHVGVKFGPSDAKRKIIHHCIRHESVHCGQLAWLIRMHGKKVI